ncbi:hypothetical protein TTHERM_000957712 (macronuclear) [Tetrahymena thermophila SB210]|uniref:Uncharacterized protein n=1 Tax=Tetrahymena thermophila (strain SB210) TaxID=312017 RepID=W7X791_TETTS|nr:hypothetical protein TTHERM_000957712 [Tetrahymena thermophila SB210]EWS73222.1 hypothetical protein TTHERM_000957712 [Tetrahymena thermophila SB210]|eukprot:XP_012654254.1 hypothetical protein TTHERM_000957712 [Tetrahymena thermophila SB210]
MHPPLQFNFHFLNIGENINNQLVIQQEKMKKNLQIIRNQLIIKLKAENEKQISQNKKEKHKMNKKTVINKKLIKNKLKEYLKEKYITDQLNRRKKLINNMRLGQLINNQIKSLK